MQSDRNYDCVVLSTLTTCHCYLQSLPPCLFYIEHILPNPNSCFAHFDHWRATLCSNNLDMSVDCVHVIQRPGLCPLLLLLLLPRSPSLSSANQISTSGPPVVKHGLIGVRYRLNSHSVQS